MNQIWIVYTEVVPEDGCVFQFKTDGAFLECYVPADNIDHALYVASTALQDNKLKTIDIDKCIRFDPEDWDDEYDPKREVRNCSTKAKSTGAVVFGKLREYEH